MTEIDHPGGTAATLGIPAIEFFYLDERLPETPSHVRWAGVTFRVDASTWSGPVESRLSIDGPIAFTAMPIELEASDYANHTRDELLALQKVKTGR
ncbi:hypothetical protein SEA_VANLEE_53 [Gordonia phage VanLee]|uniref:Uncharacterized protein n=1 Tax=Gordonia phage VanLee TaxID=2845816 RepID=A0A8F2D9E2_9CAUD|nr:hypothetical protein QEH49_gp053 [Gordonia phage VanLee]QWS68170.1 hypothetical protein SEA_VANLEE_53 [Gordonia phage VanLee]